MFTIERLCDKQLRRMASNRSFVTYYNDLVSSTNPAGRERWEFEICNRLKKDTSQFKKCLIREYLK